MRACGNATDRPSQFFRNGVGIFLMKFASPVPIAVALIVGLTRSAADGAVFIEGVGQRLDFLPTLQGRNLRPPCCNLKHKSGGNRSGCGAAPANARVARAFVPPATPQPGTARRAIPAIPLNTCTGIAPNFRCPYWTLCGDGPNRVVEPEGVMKLLTVRF